MIPTTCEEPGILDAKPIPTRRQLISRTKTGVRKTLLIVAILAAGLALRLIALDAEYLWYDEQFSTDVASQTLSHLIYLVANDAHPPLFYLVLHYYQKLIPHPTVFTLRLLPVLWGMVGLIIIYALGRRFISEPAALWSMALAAISSFLIDYSQELRTYTMVVALTLAGSYFLLLGLYNTRSRRAYFLLFALFSVLQLYSHYHTIFYILSQGIFVAGWCWRRRQWDVLGEWIFSMALVGFVYGLWLPYQIHQFFTANIHWLPPLTVNLTLLFPISFVLLWGLHLHLVALRTPVVIALMIVLAGLWWMGRRRDGAPGKKPTTVAALWLMAAVSFGPIIMVTAVSLTIQNLFFPRYLIFTAPGFILLAGYALTQMRARWAAAAFGLVLAINMTRTVNEYVVRNKEDWRVQFDFAVAEVGPQGTFLFQSDVLYDAFCRHTHLKPPRLIISESLPHLEKIAAESPPPNIALLFYHTRFIVDEFPVDLISSQANPREKHRLSSGPPMMVCRNVNLSEHFEHQAAVRDRMNADYAAWWLPSDPAFNHSFHKLEVYRSCDLFRWSRGAQGALELPVELPPGEYEVVIQINTWRPENATRHQLKLALNGQPWPDQDESGGPQTLTGRLRLEEGDTKLRLDFDVSSWSPCDTISGATDWRELGFMINWVALKHDD